MTKAKFIYCMSPPKLLTAHYQNQKCVLSGLLQGSELGLVSGTVFISNLHNRTEDTPKSADHQDLILQVCWITGLELKIILSN